MFHPHEGAFVSRTVAKLDEKCAAKKGSDKVHFIFYFFIERKSSKHKDCMVN